MVTVHTNRAADFVGVIATPNVLPIPIEETSLNILGHATRLADLFESRGWKQREQGEAQLFLTARSRWHGGTYFMFRIGILCNCDVCCHFAIVLETGKRV